MKDIIQNPWAVLAIALLIFLSVFLLIRLGYTIENIKIPGVFEIDVNPPIAPTIPESHNKRVVEPTLEKRSPIILDIEERNERDVNNNLVIHEDIYFSDSDGDAYVVDYRVKSVSGISSNKIAVERDPIQSTTDEQKSRAQVAATWQCGYTSNYSIILEARILDRAGNQSEPEDIQFDCP